MSKVPAQIRAYVRPSRRHGQKEQTAALLAAGIDGTLIYVESKDETLADCLKSLMPGDTLAVTTLARLHSRWDGIVATVHELAAKRVTLWEVVPDRKFEPGQMSLALESAVEAREELANDKHRFTSQSGRKAADIQHGRTKTAVARAIWQNTADYPTIAEALAHPDMDGWTQTEAYRKLLPRGTAVRRKR